MIQCCEDKRNGFAHSGGAGEKFCAADGREGREGKKRKREYKVKRPESESGEVEEGGCGERKKAPQVTGIIPFNHTAPKRAKPQCNG